MITHREFKQGSLEWLMARVGLPTASDMDQILTPLGKVRDGKMFSSFVAAKLAEAWSGTPSADVNSWAMDQGVLLEEECLPWLSLEIGKAVEQVGFITTDDGKVGCSPDGIIDGKIGVEAKCPQRTNHVKYLLAGVVPEDYRIQVQCGLYVTGFNSWMFVSYARRMPKLVLTVEPDQKIQEGIAEAVSAFQESFKAGWERLCELNDGPPKRFTAPAPKEQFVSTMPS